MALIASGKGKDFEQAPLGPQQAVCSAVEDVGTHESMYQGQMKKRHQIVLIFETAEKQTEGKFSGNPFTMGIFYTLSLSEKSNLAKDLESWFGKKFTPEQRVEGFDLEKLIGFNCLLNIVEKPKKDGSIGRAIGGIMPLPKNMTKIIPSNLPVPEWVAKKRSESIEAKESQFPASDRADHHDEPVEDDLPF